MEAYRYILPPFNDKIYAKRKSSDTLTLGEFTLQSTPDGRTVMWNWKTSKSRYVFAGHDGNVSCISKGLEQGSFFTGGWDGKICRWVVPEKLDKDSDREIPPKAKSEGLPVFVKSVAALRHCGRDIVLAGYNNGAVRILDGTSLKFLDSEITSELHTLAVNTIIVWHTTSETVVITGSSDRTVKFSLLKAAEPASNRGEFILQTVKVFCPIETGVQNDSTSVWSMSVCSAELFSTAHKVAEGSLNGRVIPAKVLEGDKGVLCVATGDKCVRLYKISTDRAAEGSNPDVKITLLGDKCFPDWVMATAPMRTSDILLHDTGDVGTVAKESSTQVTFFCGCRDGSIYPLRTNGSAVVTGKEEEGDGEGEGEEDGKRERPAVTANSELCPNANDTPPADPDAPLKGNVGHICSVEVAYMKDTAADTDTDTASGSSSERIPVLISSGTEPVLYRRRLVKAAKEEKGVSTWGDDEGDDEIKDLLEDPEVVELQQKRLRAMLEADLEGMKKW